MKGDLFFCYIENLKCTSLLDFSQLFNKSDFDLKNNYYLPAFIDPLSMEFPAWTNVIQDCFQSPHDIATLIRSRAYFSDAHCQKKENIKELIKY